jgi:hypothetical protein
MLADEHETTDVVCVQNLVEVGLGERRVEVLVEHEVTGSRLQLIDDRRTARSPHRMRAKDPELDVCEVMGVVGLGNPPVIARARALQRRRDRFDDRFGCSVSEHTIDKVVEHVHYDERCAHRDHLLHR